MAGAAFQDHRAGPVARAPSDFVYPVMPDRAGANDFKFVFLHFHNLPPLHDRGGIQHRTHNLIITSAPAQVPCQTIANLVLGGVGITIEQRLGGDQKTRGADAALQRGVLEELLL